MNNARSYLACSVFEGRIVVSDEINNGTLNTVEGYDHVGDAWENMSNLINGRFCHKSVAVKNKLFVIGGYINKCEVFDSITNKFTLLKQPTLDSTSDYLQIFRLPPGVISNENEIFVFSNNRKVLTYNFENDKWSVKSCESTKDIRLFSFVEIPAINYHEKTQLKKNRVIAFLLIALFFLNCFVF